MKLLSSQDFSIVYGGMGGGNAAAGQASVTCESVVGTLATVTIDAGVGALTMFNTPLGFAAGAAVGITGIDSALGQTFANWACSPSQSTPSQSTPAQSTQSTYPSSPGFSSAPDYSYTPQDMGMCTMSNYDSSM